jgi:hypothetical protein
LKEYSVWVETKSHTCIPLARWGDLTGGQIADSIWTEMTLLR